MSTSPHEELTVGMLRSDAGRARTWARRDRADRGVSMTSTETFEGSPTTSSGGWSDILRVIAALGLAGAGIIHFAYAPGHLDTETSHGVFFLVVGWVQLAL